jgi:hypothetical protein
MKRSSTEVVGGASAALVGGGVVTFALFPLALPTVILTAVSVIPLALPVVALGLLIAAVALPILLVRRLVRALLRALEGEAEQRRDASPSLQRGGRQPLGRGHLGRGREREGDELLARR